MRMIVRIGIGGISAVTSMVFMTSISLAQFVPLEGSEDGSAAQPPKLKMVTPLPSAPFEVFEFENELGDKTADKTLDAIDYQTHSVIGDEAVDEMGNKSGVAVAIEPESTPKDEPDNLDAWLAFSAFQRGQYLTAMELALPRAQLGDPAAQTLIAELFAEGFGVSRSMDDAVFWYDQAAKNGDPTAQYKLALMLTDGRYIEPDEERARELMKASAQAGNPKAQFNHAQLLLSERPGQKGIAEALPFFERAAAKGIPDASYALSQIYNNADSIPDEKRALARRHLFAAARAGFDTAQVDLAIWLIDGVNGDRDFDAGFEWMRLAAIRGNVVAQNRLAYLYIHAIGTRGDPIEAGKWYIVSRRAGLEDAGLEDFYQGLTTDEQKQSIEAANKLSF